jgi:hypothetical protein
MSDNKKLKPNKIVADVIDMPFNREDGIGVFVGGNRDTASAGVPSKELDLEHRAYYLALKNVTGQLVGAYSVEQLQEFSTVNHVEGNYIAWSSEFIVWVEETQQREEVSDEIIEELVAQAKFFGTKLVEFLKKDD